MLAGAGLGRSAVRRGRARVHVMAMRFDALLGSNRGRSGRGWDVVWTWFAFRANQYKSNACADTTPRRIFFFPIPGVFALLLIIPAIAAAATNVHGVSVASLHRGGFAYGSEECRKQLAAIAAVGGNWVAISDFAFMRSVDQPHLRFGNGGRSGEGDIAQVIRDAHAAGLKVLVKPHVWSGDFGRRGGKWHGDIRMTTDADWDQWFTEYGEYILAQARVAADSRADAVGVALEYDGTIDQESHWRKLIADVRK